MPRTRWMLLVLVLGGLLTACASKSETPSKVEPAYLEPIEETGLSRVTLTARASERLGLQTASVLEADGDSHQTTIPYASVIYDVNGDTWAYASPEPLVFVRQSISVDRIEGDLAVLSDGPAVGVQVVTVGVAELYGAESGVGH